MTGFTLLGVPIDSVGRDGGTELAPAALRELGIADLTDRGRGRRRRPHPRGGP